MFIIYTAIILGVFVVLGVISHFMGDKVFNFFKKIM
jgi:type III secretory pathway component EscS